MASSMYLLAGLSMASAAAAATTTYAKTTTFTFGGTTLPTGLAKSDYVVEDPAPAPQWHEFVPDNVYVSGGYLNLLVNGGQQNDDVIWGGEVTTTFTMKSADVTTYAILTDVAGVCNGNFLYASDSQETDIEWLSDKNSQSNIDAGLGRALFYTNQALDGNSDDATSHAGSAPSTATSAVHAYRIVWNAGSTTFYVDGVKQYTFTTNVPTAKNATWIWNNWSNGDPGWTNTPPATDAVFKIQKIVMNYNP